VLPELDLARIKRFCAGRVPSELLNKVRVEATARGANVTLFECRPRWGGSPGDWTRVPIAQLRYEGDGKWTLYFQNRNDRWAVYPELEPSQPVAVLIEQIDEDPAFVFWG
jgi:hypothetical protein